MKMSAASTTSANNNSCGGEVQPMHYCMPIIDMNSLQAPPPNGIADGNRAAAQSGSSDPQNCNDWSYVGGGGGGVNVSAWHSRSDVPWPWNVSSAALKCQDELMREKQRHYRRELEQQIAEKKCRQLRERQQKQLEDELIDRKVNADNMLMMWEHEQEQKRRLLCERAANCRNLYSSSKPNSRDQCTSSKPVTSRLPYQQKCPKPAPLSPKRKQAPSGCDPCRPCCDVSSSSSCAENDILQCLSRARVELCCQQNRIDQALKRQIFNDILNDLEDYRALQQQREAEAEKMKCSPPTVSQSTQTCAPAAARAPKTAPVPVPAAPASTHEDQKDDKLEEVEEKLEEEEQEEEEEEEEEEDDKEETLSIVTKDEAAQTDQPDQSFEPSRPTSARPSTKAESFLEDG